MTVITAIDRKAGTVTLEPDTLFLSPQLYRAMQRELSKSIDLTSLRNFSVGDKLVFGVTRTTDTTRLAGCRLRRPAALTPAVVVTLATLGAFEWLRHRKAEVAAAEASGDYTTLIQEFVTWLRGLLQAWREAAARR